MKFRALLLFAVLLSLVAIVCAEPKAYDLVKYSGKAAGATIAFDFADGYPEASTLRVTDAGSTKRTNYLMDDAAAKRWVPEKSTGGGKNIILQIDMDSAAPAKITGTYTNAGKSTSFTLTKSKK